MKRVRVNVTARDIERGVRGSETSCPVAIAIERTAWGRREMFKVTGVRLIRPFEGSVPLPPAASKFVVSFDSGLPVEPFTFTLEVPE